MPKYADHDTDGRLARLVAHVRTPLFGGAYALMLSGAISSGLGIIYWALAARLYDAAQVGANAAAISAMMLISFLAQLNLAGVLSRFIPTAGAGTRRFILLAYVTAGALSAVGSLIFVVAIAPLVGLGPMLTVDRWGWVWFVIATVAWTLFTLQDGALTGLRQTVWVPIENAVFGLAKIVLLVIFVTGLAAFGIFASWTIPALVLLVPVNWLIFRRFVPRRTRAEPPVATSALPPGTLRYMTGDYIGSLFRATSVDLLPLLVVLLAGARAGAYFYIAWTIAFSLYAISFNIATSLMVEGAARRATVARDTLRMLRLMLGLQTMVVLVVIIGAPIILSIFNPAYASEATDLLRLLALAALPNGVITIFLAVARVHHQIGRIILVQATLAALTLGASVALLDRLGIIGVGIAWLGAQSIVAVIVLLTQLLPLRTRRIATGAPDLPGLAPDLPVLTADRNALAADRNAGEGPAPRPGLMLACYAALDEAGVRWAQLRGDPADAAQGARDVDLLVAAADLPLLARIFANLNLIRVPTAGHAPGGYFVGRDIDTGAWVRLDVTVDLTFGRFGQFETGLAATCLARLQRSDGIPVLLPDDAFWALVMHCILDKGFVADRHAARLSGLVDQVSDDGPLGTFMGSILPADWDAARVRAVVRDGDWTMLLGLRTGMLLRLWRRDILGTTRRAFGRAIQRTPGIGFLIRGRWGVSVALLGPDGAGKTTLSAAIAADFGLPVRRVYMGMWSNSERGVLGWIPGLSVVARPMAAFRKGLIGEYHRARGRLVMFDRYTYDALLPPRGRLVLLNRAYLWILAHAAPAPQLVVVLDAPGELLFARKGEFDPIRLEEDRRAFRALGGRVASLRVVDAARPAEAVRAEVTALIWQRYLDDSRDE